MTDIIPYIDLTASPALCSSPLPTVDLTTFNLQYACKVHDMMECFICAMSESKLQKFLGESNASNSTITFQQISSVPPVPSNTPEMISSLYNTYENSATNFYPQHNTVDSTHFNFTKQISSMLPVQSEIISDYQNFEHQVDYFNITEENFSMLPTQSEITISGLNSSDSNFNTDLNTPHNYDFGCFNLDNDEIPTKRMRGNYEQFSGAESSLNAQVVDWEGYSRALQIDALERDHEMNLNNILDEYFSITNLEQVKFDNFYNEVEFNNLCNAVQERPLYSPISPCDQTANNGCVQNYTGDNFDVGVVSSFCNNKIVSRKVDIFDTTCNHNVGEVEVYEFVEEQIGESSSSQQLDRPHNHYMQIGNTQERRFKQTTLVDTSITVDDVSFNSAIQTSEFSMEIPNKINVDRFLQAKPKKSLNSTDVRRSCALMKSLMHSYFDLGKTFSKNIRKRNLLGEVKQSLERHSQLLLDCAGIMLTPPENKSNKNQP